MSWELHGDGRRCARHDETFPLADVCPKCIVDPGARPAETVGDVINLDALADERDVRNFAKVAKRRCEELSSGTEREVGPATKWGDLYLKAMRLASEMRQKRADHEHDRMLIEHEREMAGLRGSH